MDSLMNVVLIGYRGTGKSTVAQRLALRWGWDWCDSDVEIELRAGRSIAAIFADSGEPAFRDQETEVLRQLVQRPNLVIAAGGGIVLRAENRQLLATATAVVWLTASVATIAARVAEDPTTASRRPNLLAGGEDEIRQILEQRTPLYRASALIEVDTEGRTPEQVVDVIVARLPQITGTRRPG